MTMDYHERQRRLSEQRDRDRALQKTAAVAHQQMQQLERRAGMPSPRVRALAAGPLKSVGPIVDTVTVRRMTYHRIPSLDTTHRTDAGSACWCGPSVTHDGPTSRTVTHNVTAPWEQGAADPDVLTADQLDHARRVERG